MHIQSTQFVHSLWHSLLIRFAGGWMLLTYLVFAPVLGWPQSLNPQDNAHFSVRQFELIGLNEINTPGLTAVQVQSQLKQERGRFKPEMSVDEIHKVAEALTLFLRQQGYVFHTVVLMPQQVQGGIVDLQLQPGVLKGINVINKTPWPAKRVRRPFKTLLGQPLVARQVEDRVHAVKALGGIDVFAFYSKAVKPGEVILNLRVEKEAKRRLGVRLDNYGSVTNGEHRMIAQYTEYQLTGRHDQLSLAAMLTDAEKSNFYGSLTYQLPFQNLDYQWDLGASNHQFGLGGQLDALALEGKANTIRTGFTKILNHHAERRQQWRLGFYQKKNALDALAVNVSDEVSRAVTVGWSKANTQRKTERATQLNLEYAYAQYDIEGVPSGDFNRLEAQISMLRMAGKGRLRNAWQWNLKGQYADGRMPSMEGFALSGAYAVRAYEPGLFNADSAVFNSLEWRLPNAWQPAARGRLEPYVFVEHAYGRRYDLNGGSTEAQLSGAGLGLRFQWGKHWQFNLVSAHALSGEIDGRGVKGDDQILFEIRLD